jgi:hypothetical protein
MTIIDPETGVTFTDHAQVKMAERGVSRGEVARVISRSSADPPGQRPARFVAFIGDRVIWVIRSAEGVAITAITP